MVSFPRYFTVCITYQPPLVYVLVKMIKVSTAQCNNSTGWIHGLTAVYISTDSEDEMTVLSEVNAVVFHPPELTAVLLHPPEFTAVLLHPSDVTAVLLHSSHVTAVLLHPTDVTAVLLHPAITIQAVRQFTIPSTLSSDSPLNMYSFFLTS